MRNSIAKPFLKWAGGKTQLLGAIEKALPLNIQQNKFTYIEPFVGSGAVMFWVLNNFPNVEQVIINDINTDLVKTYKAIKNKPKQLISLLADFQNDYHSICGDEEKEKIYYYDKRVLFNTRKSNSVEQAALLIFLNRTCFNGLFRVNAKNEFNVPKGRYNKPTICDAENILSVSSALQTVEILNGDFENTLYYAKPKSFFYFDPPYKPLSNTSSFNTYAKDEFNDAEQIRLAEFCKKLDVMGYDWMLSNSDLKGKDINDNFSDDIYNDYFITRVRARRSINANADKRGELKEFYNAA